MAEPNSTNDNGQDSAYNSASDDDFAPDHQPAEGTSSSESDSDTEQPRKRRKVSQINGNADVNALDFDNSGDEATIKRAKRKKKKKGGEDDDALSEGGEGGLIKTRAQRKAEIKDKRPLAEANKSTVNVDALWASMSSGAAAAPDKMIARDSPEQGPAQHPSAGQPTEMSLDSVSADVQTSNEVHDETSKQPSQATVEIMRTYEFAGQVTEEKKTVPADSTEAKLYQEEMKRLHESQNASQMPIKRRPMKRRLFTNGTENSNQGAGSGTAEAGKVKLNTLEKSKLDWAAHVDKEGISDELNEAGKAKNAYLDRVDFLGRMDAKREEDSRGTK